MAMGLYDPAFATLACLYGRAARGPITGITLVAGFASTVAGRCRGCLRFCGSSCLRGSRLSRPNHHTLDPIITQEIL